MAITNNKNVKIETESSSGSLVDLSEHWEFGGDSIRFEGKNDFSFLEDSSLDYTIWFHCDDTGKVILDEVKFYKKPNRFVRWWRGTWLYRKLFWKHYTLERKTNDF